jgi:hypothetical protein
MMRERGREPWMAFNIAYVYAGLGDKDQTLKWLETQFDERGYLLTLKASPEWDVIRDEPRYLALLKKLGLDR